MKKNKLTEYLKSSKLETFSEDYKEGYKDCIKDFLRYNSKEEYEKNTIKM